MDVKSILIKDTDGALTGDLLKIYLDKQALSVTFNYSAVEQSLDFVLNNVRYDSIPGINDAFTYISFLTYNGTMGYDGRVFSTILKQDHGIFNKTELPILTYTPNEYISTLDIDTASDSVLEINMLSGDITILDYYSFPYRSNNREYKVQYKHAYPARVYGVPNVVSRQVFLDGWYSFTHVLFRDVGINSFVTKDKTYAIGGFIFVASISGLLSINPETNLYSINIAVPGGGENSAIIGQSQPTQHSHTPANIPPIDPAEDPAVLTEIPIYVDQIENIDYEAILFYLNEQSSISKNAPAVFSHSQVLITQQLKDAIVNEVINTTTCFKTGCDFMDWQKLQLKQAASFVSFDNLMFEKAQVIIESSRSMCLGNLDNTKLC